jgi:hypothetical protein
MVVLPSTGASRYHNCCIDGGTVRNILDTPSYLLHTGKTVVFYGKLDVLVKLFFDQMKVSLEISVGLPYQISSILMEPFGRLIMQMIVASSFPFDFMHDA